MDKNTCATEKLKEIFEIAKNLTSVIDVDALLKRVDAAAQQLLEAEAASIMLLEEDRETLSFKVASGEKAGAVQKMKVKVGQGIAGAAAQEKKPVLANDVTRDSRFSDQIDRVSGFTTRSALAVPMLADNELVGIIEVLNKKSGPFTADDVAVLESLASLMSASIANARNAEDQRNFFVNMIDVLVSAIESRDPKLAGHAWNIAQFATAIARRLELKDQEYKNVYYGALLHDIGLIKVSGLEVADGIITSKEQDVESTHPRVGAEIVRNINLLRGAVPVIRHHHEHFDGSGLPDGLAGKNIPLGARIVAVAEAIEEMRLSGFPDSRIKQMLQLGKETRFDPEIVDLYVKEFYEVVA